MKSTFTLWIDLFIRPDFDQARYGSSGIATPANRTTEVDWSRLIDADRYKSRNVFIGRMDWE